MKISINRELTSRNRFLVETNNKYREKNFLKSSLGQIYHRN